MADQTHSVTVSKVNDQDTAIAHVPAEAQREGRFVIDDRMEVTIEELGGLFNSISFEAKQNAGDQITVPAEVVRKSGLEAGERYPMTFERVEDDSVEDEAEEASEEEGLGSLFADDEEYVVSDEELTDDEDDVENDADDILDEIESEFEDAEDDIEEEVEEEPEEEEEGLGSLFS